MHEKKLPNIFTSKYPTRFRLFSDAFFFLQRNKYIFYKVHTRPTEQKVSSSSVTTATKNKMHTFTNLYKYF